MPERNVLLIIADQFRWDCLGVAGNPVIKTPNLNALAAEGVLFSSTFVQTVPCGPSRMCLFTGRYLCSTRAVDNMTPLVDAEENLGMYLRAGGYRSAMAGYNDYAVDPRTLPDTDSRTRALSYDNFLPGFDEILKHEYHSPAYFDYLRSKGYPENLCCPHICTEYAVPEVGPGDHLPLHYPAHYRAEDSEARFLTQRGVDFMKAQDAPGWMLSMNYIKPHPPRICPTPYHAMYDPADMPRANRRPEELESGHPYLRAAHAEPALVNERDLRETQACYYGMISEIDACVGALLQALRESDQWDNTLIIFTSDHGEYLGDHYFTDKAHFYDETMRVPLIVRDPTAAADRTRGRHDTGFAELIDIAPTVLEWCGLPVPDRMQGRSLLNRMHGQPEAAPRKEIHFEFDYRNRLWRNKACPDDNLLWVLRSEDYKYVQFADPDIPPLLFDLRNDPGEFQNLADKAEYAPVIADYCQRMLQWRMKNEDQRMEHWAARLREAAK